MSENLKEKQDATGYQLQFEKIHANNGTVCWVWQQSTNSVRPDWNNDLCSPTLKNNIKNGIWKHGVSATKPPKSGSTGFPRRQWSRGPRSPAKHSFLRYLPSGYIARTINLALGQDMFNPCSSHLILVQAPILRSHIHCLCWGYVL